MDLKCWFTSISHCCGVCHCWFVELLIEYNLLNQEMFIQQRKYVTVVIPFYCYLKY